MMPSRLLLLFHLTIVILLVTSLHLILSIPKLVKIYQKSAFLKLNKQSETDRELIQSLYPIKSKLLSQQLEEIQFNIQKFQLRINRINGIIEQTSRDTQKILQQYFRPFQWSKSNKK